MKYCVYLIALFSLISLIYSDCTAPQVDVSGVEGTELCGTAIENCKTYDATSSASTPLCGTCNTGSKLTASKKKCLLGCKTEGTDANADKCTECNDGYTLSSGACTASSGSPGGDNNNNSFSLHGSLLTILLLILF